MGDVAVISTAHAFQHNFQLFVIQKWALCWKFLLSLEYPDRRSLTLAVIPLSHWSALNIPVFNCPHNQKFRGLRSGDGAGQLPVPPCPIHCSPKVWFKCCTTMRRKWSGAPSCMNHTCCHWWRGTCSKSTGKSFTRNYGTLHLLVC
jgi:hypothetical protein